jgi:chorismate mutase / prephenate dehydrogenase
MSDPRLQSRIKDLRDQLDQVDADLVKLAARRQQIVSDIGRLKQGEGRQLRDFRREREVVEGVRLQASRSGLDPDVAEDLLKRLIEASLTRQERERGQLSGHGQGRRALVIGGGGLMGRWLAEFLENQGFDVLLADPALDGDDKSVFADWHQAPLDVNLIAIAAPLQTSAGILSELATIGTDALVFDIASIKTPLLAALQQAADAGLKVCSIHPMFGPDTRLLSGRHVLLMDVGCKEAVSEAGHLFAETMAEVKQIEINEHDRLVALVLGLSHAVNIAFFTALTGSGISAGQLAGVSSTTFKRQLDIARDVASENPDLYYEIQRLNEHGPHARQALLNAVAEIQAAIEGEDLSRFRELMLTGRDYIKGLPD